MLLLASLLLVATSAYAEVDGSLEVSAESPTERRHLIYVDAFGRLGPYAVGYEYRLVGPLSVGGAGSVYGASGRRVLAAAGYVGVEHTLTGSHGLFAQVGALVVHETEPVLELAATGVGGQLVAGYQWAAERWIFRVQAVATAGERDANLWAGATVGLRF
jgi:hypothetical protein